MGSLFSSPKAPKIRPYIAPLPVNAREKIEPEKTEKEVSSDIRKQNLLLRARGKAGTVLTSLAGYFDNEDKSAVTHKKLLGE